MDENRKGTANSIFIGCGVLSILLAVIWFTILRFSANDVAETVGFFFFGLGYLLLGLSRTNARNADRQTLYSNATTIALVLGTLFVSYWTYTFLSE